MSIVRVGLGESKDFSAGYSAIFGDKPKATAKAKPATAAKAKPKPKPKKKPAPKKTT